MSLACGGRGPCCHVGYAHRHCEHCDVVIAITPQPHTHYPWYSPTYYGTIGGQLGGFNSLANQLQQLASPSTHLVEVTNDGNERSA